MYHIIGDNVARAHLALRVVGSQIATSNEQSALDGCQEVAVALVGAVCDEYADVAIQLVECAIAFKAFAALADALTTYEAGLTLVACLSIYFQFFEWVFLSPRSEAGNMCCYTYYCILYYLSYTYLTTNILVHAPLLPSSSVQRA